MTPNSRIVRLGCRDYLVIDLSLPLSLDQQGYPGDFQPTRSVFSDIRQDGWQHYTHALGDHCFHPHCDAPNHFDTDQQERGMEIYDLSWSFHRACLIDLSGSPEAAEHEGIRFLTNITKEHLIPFTEILSTSEAVIIRTGYDLWSEKNYSHIPEWIPYLTEEASTFIDSFPGIKVIGTDSLTVDAYGLQVSHLVFKDKMIVESLVHLHEIPRENWAGFTFQTSPVRIVGATGGPVIAYAYLDI